MANALYRTSYTRRHVEEAQLPDSATDLKTSTFVTSYNHSLARQHSVLLPWPALMDVAPCKVIYVSLIFSLLFTYISVLTLQRLLL